MASEGLTRRGFGAALGTAAGAVLLEGVVTPRFAEARLRRGMAPDTIQLNANECPYGPSPAARAAMTRSQEVAARYPGDLEEDARVAVARLHGVRPDQVVLGCGSGEILRIADAAFTRPDRTVVVAEPTFEAVLDYAKVTRAPAVKVPLDGEFRTDLARMAEACDARTGLVYLCNPNNPTGTVVSGDELLGFLKRVPASVTIVLDEAYHHFVEDPSYRSGFEYLAGCPNLVVVRTFSKVYGMAGMRLGYAVASPELAATLGSHAVRNNANAAVLAAAIASLADEALEPRVRRLMNDTRRWLVEQLLAEGRRVIPSQANFVMFETGRDVKPVVAAFAERGILVGRRFASMPTWLRVSIGTPDEMKAFLAALRVVVPAGGRAVA